MQKSVGIVLGLLVAITLSGCANSGAFLSSHQTSVELSEANYEIVATDVAGTGTLAYAFGASYSLGAVSHSFGLFKVEGSGAIYQEALQDLWDKVEADYGKTDGKSVALTNVRYDADTMNLFFYSKLKVTVRADLVEFTK